MLRQLSKRSASLLLSALLAFPQGLVLPAAAADKPVTLDGIEAAKDQVTVKLSAPAQYNSFLTANPPRLILELMNTEFQAGPKTIEGKGRYIKRVRSGQFERSPRMVARIVMDLSEVAGYRVVESATGLRVEIVSAEETAAAAAAPSKAAEEPAKPAAEPAPAPAAAPEVPAVAAAPARPAVKPKPKAAVPAEHSPELAAMAMSADASKAAMAPAAKEAPAPAAPAAPAPEPRRYARASGDILSRMPRDLVTLDFDNTDVRDIIKLLAAKARVNIIHGPDVSGSLSLHLTDVPFNEAFRTILSMLNLVTIQVGDNILRVLTPAELTKQRTATTAVTKVIPLNYSKASDLVTAIAAVRTAEGRTGAATADGKTNSLIITEPLEGLAATERLIAQLDSRPKQVLIEAKLVEVSLNDSLHYGIQWDYLSSEPSKIAGQQGRNLVGTLTSPAAGSSPTLNPLDQNANAIPSVGASGRGTGVNLSANAIFGALTLGRITNNYFLSATLTAAAAQGKVKVLSDPKIATLNNQPANINVTTSIPYVTSNVASTGVQTQTVSYVVTGIKLLVTPTINADGRITLDINPDVSQPSATAAASTLTGAPAVDARQAKTSVLVKDGETIVIGGLISDSVSNQVAKIPILGDIPILGWLFRKKSVVRTRSELLIFVTPKIMPD